MMPKTTYKGRSFRKADNFQHDFNLEDNFSDKELYARNLPAIGTLR